MPDLYMIPKFLKQLSGLGFSVGNISEPVQVRRVFGNYAETVQRFRVGWRRAKVGEKYSPHRIVYRGPIPNPNNPRKLTFFPRTLKAYESEDGGWELIHPYKHVDFP